MKLFVDAGVLIAAVHTRDRMHEPAREIVGRISQGEWSSVHTSDYVVAEALNFVQARLGKRQAAEGILEFVLGRPDAPPAMTSVLRIHSTRFAAAVERYRRHFDAGLSLTDCTTLVAMGDERIKQLATFDNGFRGLVDVVDGA